MGLSLFNTPMEIELMLINIFCSSIRHLIGSIGLEVLIELIKSSGGRSLGLQHRAIAQVTMAITADHHQ